MVITNKTNPHSGFVVSKRNTGLGDKLICLSAAWRYARAFNRTLLVDWTGACYQTGAAYENPFTTLFVAQQTVSGVELIADNLQNFCCRTDSFYPSSWNSKNISREAQETRRGKTEQIQLIQRLAPCSERFVVFNECLSDAAPAMKESHEFFSSLQFQPKLLEDFYRIKDQLLANKKAIGIHIRHGNGGNIMEHSKFWTDPKKSLAQCVLVIEKALDAYQDKPHVIFLSTDSLLVELFLKHKFPQLVTLKKQFKAVGEGELHIGNPDSEALWLAALDMLMLAQANILIRFPEISFFSHYAEVMKPVSGLSASEKEAFHELQTWLLDVPPPKIVL